MSSLFNKHSEIYGVKKCFENSVFNPFSSNMLDENPLLSQDEGQDEPESVPESWIELTPSRISFCSSLAMDEANSSFGGINKDSQSSPNSIQGSNVEFELNLEQVKYKLNKDVISKNTDRIWGWYNRPEIFLKNSNLQQKLHQTESALTTPPNSPELDRLFPDNLFDFFSFQKSKKQSLLSSFLRFKVIVSFVISNIMTFVLGATIGFCVCKKLYKK